MIPCNVEPFAEEFQIFRAVFGETLAVLLLASAGPQLSLPLLEGLHNDGHAPTDALQFGEHTHLLLDVIQDGEPLRHGGDTGCERRECQDLGVDQAPSLVS